MENIKKMARPPPNADYTFLVGDPNFDNLTNRCWWNGIVLVSWWFYRSAMFQHSRELGNRFRTKDCNSQQACDKAILNYYEYSRNKAIEFFLGPWRRRRFWKLEPLFLPRTCVSVCRVCFPGLKILIRRVDNKKSTQTQLQHKVGTKKLPKDNSNLARLPISFLVTT